MKSILRGLSCAVLVAGFAACASAATMTMNGMISDSDVRRQSRENDDGPPWHD